MKEDVESVTKSSEESLGCLVDINGNTHPNSPF